MIAVDSPVLIELLSDGPRADAVEACLRQALVGAHAMLQCDGLVTWHDAFYRDYFKGLKLIVPQA